MRRAARAEGLIEELKTLTGLSCEDVIARWVALYGGAPPPRTSRSPMIRAVAYKMQERVDGGLRASTRRALADKSRSATTLPPPEARPGTVLLREWHGITHLLKKRSLAGRKTVGTFLRAVSQDESSHFQLLLNCCNGAAYTNIIGW